MITSRGNNTCVLIGTSRTAYRVVIERNRISNCGERGKLDHLIYAAHTRNAVVRRNRLTANGGGWAVHLYPDADGTRVERNDIAGNLGGVIFGGDGEGQTSDLNVVRGNSIVGSGVRWNLESSWSGGPEGARNVARDNCVHSSGPGAPSGIGPSAGVALEANRVVLRARRCCSCSSAPLPWIRKGSAGGWATAADGGSRHRTNVQMPA